MSLYLTFTVLNGSKFSSSFMLTVWGFDKNPTVVNNSNSNVSYLTISLDNICSALELKLTEIIEGFQTKPQIKLVEISRSLSPFLFTICSGVTKRKKTQRRFHAFIRFRICSLWALRKFEVRKTQF